MGINRGGVGVLLPWVAVEWRADMASLARRIALIAPDGCVKEWRLYWTTASLETWHREREVTTTRR
jgi:hypothetical protein